LEIILSFRPLLLPSELSPSPSPSLLLPFLSVTYFWLYKQRLIMAKQIIFKAVEKGVLNV
jgi:hypothetical protein